MRDDVRERLTDLEQKVSGVVEVCAAVADDTLRMCFVLDELQRAGQLPPLPWEVATMLVELHHAVQAQNNGMKTAGEEPIEQRIAAIKAEVKRLRDEYQTSLPIPEPDHEAGSTE